MFTFSQLVDEICQEVRRPDLTSEIARYLNQTIRECHSDTQTNSDSFFKENAKELQITQLTDSAVVWDVPNPTRFQQLAAVCYPDVFDSSGNPVWATQTTPGRHLNQLERYFYRIGSSFVFAGNGGRNSHINLFWYEYPASLHYFPPSCRPANYRDGYGFEYGVNWICEEDQEDARILTTNWMILRWNQVLAEGVRAKVYKRTSDDSRARMCYSLFMQGKQHMWTAESQHTMSHSR
jgi:hypothetical protein